MGDVPSSPNAAVHTYHDGTKHHFHAFARSLGYLDWASQPNPFRSFAGAQVLALPPAPGAEWDGPPIGPILRTAFGLTAWKAFGQSRWSLRANPSSGNLHPTEAYVVAGVRGSGRSTVCHYAADRHALEERCVFASPLADDVILIALTSIHWRESWKYGERAFRYCQHDIGHAIAALTVAASLDGWRTVLLADWSGDDIARLVGCDRDDDYIDAEREEPACVLALTAGPNPIVNRTALVEAVGRGEWRGRANQLSVTHVQWTFIDQVAEATRIAPLDRPPPSSSGRRAGEPRYDRMIVLRRRSAVAFDGHSTLPAARFFEMLHQTLPAQSTLLDTIWWTPRIHFALFVHRVEDLEPGLYLFERDPSSGERLRRHLGREFDVAPVVDSLPLFGLVQGDCRRAAQRVSCDQEIAADGFFSLGMVAEFDASLQEFGPSFYRHLFWEAGFVGQLLYLEAERAGARATGIGCFYDDPVHEILGLKAHTFQSLYHFTIGVPVEDTRITTSRGYGWETI